MEGRLCDGSLNNLLFKESHEKAIGAKLIFLGDMIIEFLNSSFEFNIKGSLEVLNCCFIMFLLRLVVVCERNFKLC